MTEEEAKTKWCPFARVIQRVPFHDDQPDPGAGNRQSRWGCERSVTHGALLGVFPSKNPLGARMRRSASLAISA